MSEEPKIGEEMRRMVNEPILPAEKKLVGWSIGLGVALLGILIWISRRWF